jgi:hypothetical protein
MAAIGVLPSPTFCSAMSKRRFTKEQEDLVQAGEIENGRLLFLGLGLALSQSGQLSAQRFFDFLTNIDVSEENFLSVFTSYDAFLDDLHSLKKRADRSCCANVLR